MKVYVILENRYSNGNEYPLLHGVYANYDNARKKFEAVRTGLASWLASKVEEEDFEIESNTADFYSIYDGATGNYSAEVTVFTEDLLTMNSFITDEKLTKVCQYADDFREKVWEIMELSKENLEMGVIDRETHDRFCNEVMSIVKEHNKILRMLMPPTEV